MVAGLLRGDSRASWIEVGLGTREGEGEVLTSSLGIHFAVPQCCPGFLLPSFLFPSGELDQLLVLAEPQLGFLLPLGTS